MIRLHILSDLHLELASFEPDAAAAEQADLVCLPAISTRVSLGARRTFTKKPVIYIAGNHEFYDHYWPHLNDELLRTKHVGKRPL